MSPSAPDPFLAAVLESTAYAVIATRPDGVITVFNRAAERLLGWGAAELIGLRDPGAFHDPAEVAARAAELSAEFGRAVAPGFECFVLSAREEGHADERLWTYVRKDGVRVPVLLSVTVLRDQGGSLTGYLGVARDVSELRAAQRAVAEGEQDPLQRDHADRPAIDPAVLAGLRRELGADADAVIGEMLAAFRDDGAAQLAAFAAASTAPLLARAAHRLRGSALNLGAVALAEACQRAESAANAGDTVAAQACLPAMSEGLERTKAALARTTPS